MSNTKKTFTQRVYKVVGQIPLGKVLSYKEVARRAGNAKAARAVGSLMNKNPHDKSVVPCHRVVCADGRVGGYAKGTKKKIQILRTEGVTIKNGKIIT